MTKKKVVALVTPLLTVFLFAASAEARPQGISGRAVSGCGDTFGCHGSTSPSDQATVSLTPSSSGPLPPGTGADFTVTVDGPPAQADPENEGGFNMRSQTAGFLSPLPGDKAVQSFGPQETGHTADGNDQRSWTVRWNPPAAIPTLCEFRFVASANAVNGDNKADANDHWNTAAATLTVDLFDDTESPAGQFFRPAAGESYLFNSPLPSPGLSLVVGTINLEVRVTDDSGIASVVFEDEDLSGPQTIGAASHAGIADGTNRFWRPWDTTQQPPGPHTIRARVTDCTGKETTLSTEIFVL